LVAEDENEHQQALLASSSFDASSEPSTSAVARVAALCSRELICCKPQYKTKTLFLPMPSSEAAAAAAAECSAAGGLDEAQAAAVAFALEPSRPVAVIQGPPGKFLAAVRCPHSASHNASQFVAGNIIRRSRVLTARSLLHYERAGTGKTGVLVALVQAAVALDQSVLCAVSGQVFLRSRFMPFSL